MDPQYFFERLSANRPVFEALVVGVDSKQAKWRPEPDQWSILEVINHLHDEEREDFRARLEFLLSDPFETWPAIDPRSWPAARGYNSKDLHDSLDLFLEEREKSLSWLKTLSTPNWNNYQERPSGSMSAGDILASWLAHDFLHIRQLARLHWQYTNMVAAPYQTAYAGPWNES